LVSGLEGEVTTLQYYPEANFTSAAAVPSDSRRTGAAVRCCVPFGRADGLAVCCRDAWRWAWQTLKPSSRPRHSDGAARIVDALEANVIQAGDRRHSQCRFRGAGPEYRDAKTVMGFTGKASSRPSACSRSTAGPHGRGRNSAARREDYRLLPAIENGSAEGEASSSRRQPASALSLPGHAEVYLRSFGDDMKALLRAYEREQQPAVTIPNGSPGRGSSPTGC